MALLWKMTCNLRHPMGFSPQASHREGVNQTVLFLMTPISTFDCYWYTVGLTRGGGLGSGPKKMYGERLWGRVPFNETYAPSLSTIYDGAKVSWNFLKMVLDPSPPPLGLTQRERGQSNSPILNDTNNPQLRLQCVALVPKSRVPCWRQNM